MRGRERGQGGREARAGARGEAPTTPCPPVWVWPRDAPSQVSHPFHLLALRNSPAPVLLCPVLPVRTPRKSVLRACVYRVYVRACVSGYVHTSIRRLMMCGQVEASVNTSVANHRFSLTAVLMEKIKCCYGHGPTLRGCTCTGKPAVAARAGTNS